jgi:hypothetical protein
MTATAEPCDAVEETTGSVRAAHVFFLAGLAAIVGDMRRLTVGDDEFDYFIRIPSADFHETGERISELQFLVSERFGIGVTALPITVSR